MKLHGPTHPCALQHSQPCPPTHAPPTRPQSHCVAAPPTCAHLAALAGPPTCVHHYCTPALVWSLRHSATGLLHLNSFNGEIWEMCVLAFYQNVTHLFEDMDSFIFTFLNYETIILCQTIDSINIC